MNCFHAYAATFAKGPLEPFSFNPGRSTFMANSSRPNVIRLLAFTVSALVLAATSRRSSSHRLPNRWPRPAASIPLGKSRESATPGTQICWEREAFRWRVWHYQNYSHVGMGPEDRYGLLRGERQGRQTVEGDLSALAAQQPKRSYPLLLDACLDNSNSNHRFLGRNQISGNRKIALPRMSPECSANNFLTF
jgi:hypothetical protein